MTHCQSTPPSSHISSQWAQLLSKIPLILAGDAAPIPIDYCEADSPRLSLCGLLWEEEIEKVSALSKPMDIRKALACAHHSCAQLFKDSPNLLNFHWWCNALSQMSNPAIKQWMRDHSMLHHWVLPEASCDAGAQYSAHLPGNTPKAMLLDCDLFKDLSDGAERHVLLTSNLADDDPKKFSFATLKCVASAMQRAWEGIPTSERIAQDTSRAIKANIPATVEHRGAIALGLSNRRSKRNANISRCSDN